MKKTFILIFCLLLSLHLVAQEENIVLNTPTGAIYGTLYVPETQSTVPAVLLIAGSGPTDRNGNQPMMQNNSLKMLAEDLGQQGIATIRFDKRGIGESRAAGGKEEDLRFDYYIDDVRLWINLLAKDTRFSSVTVAGHSEGSLIGMIASENNARVKSFISIAGSALPADEIIREQLENQPQPVKDMVFPILEKLKQGEQVSDVSPALYSLFRPSVQPYMISWMKYHPQTEIKKLTVPVLIIQGTNDIQVSVNHADLLANANPKAEKKLIESMNHVLKKCDSKEQLVQLAVYTNPELPLAEGIISAMVEFINPD
ncbi:alpha/beta hydrolase [Bacteroidia bacterium]|nr:alpha/beta hydrolase [Bacteroidia bacterium]